MFSSIFSYSAPFLFLFSSIFVLIQLIFVFIQLIFVLIQLILVLIRRYSRAEGGKSGFSSRAESSA